VRVYDEDQNVMNPLSTLSGNFEDVKIDVKSKLSALWAAVMFCYVDSRWKIMTFP